MPLVTFLILAYNSEKWIEEAIRSVINQTYRDLQILIVDDGSEDKTAEKVLSFNDPRIEYYKKNHSGISSSFNYAMNKIKGDFIARIDADDYCDNQRITKQIKFLIDYPSYGIVGSNFLLVDESGKEIDKVRNPERHKQIIDQLPKRCCIWIGSALIRSGIGYKLNGYNESLVSANDWDFVIRAIGLTKFYNIQEYLSTKRIHPNSISFSNLALKETDDVLFSYNNSIIEKSTDQRELSQAYFNIGYHYYYKGEFEAANKYLSEAISKNSFNLQKVRYFIFSRYLKRFIILFRKYKLYKMLDCLRYFDRSNKYFRNKF